MIINHFGLDIKNLMKKYSLHIFPHKQILQKKTYKKNGFAIDFYQKEISTLCLRHLKNENNLIFL